MPSSKKILKRTLVAVLYYSGLPFLLREFVQKRKVTIVVFHDPSIPVTERYFRWLSAHYNIISLDKYLSARQTGDLSKLPPKALIITMDDGHLGNYKLLPLTKQYSIPITIFLCSGIVDTNRHFWFMYEKLPSSSDILKKVTEKTRVKILAESGFDREKEFEHPQALNKKQISEMKQFINFQSHTVFHPCLPQCSDEESQYEIVQSKDQLEKEFNLSVNALAYPNGDYSEREVLLARQAGYTCAALVGHGYNDAATDLFKLRRLSVSDNDDTKLLAIKASGLWSYLKYIFKTVTGVKLNTK